MKKKLILILILLFSFNITVFANDEINDNSEDVYQEEQIEDSEDLEDSDDIEDVEETKKIGSSDYITKVSVNKAVKIALEKFPELYPVKAELAWYKSGPVWKVYLKESDVMWKYIKIDAESGKIKGRKFSSKRVTKTCAKDKDVWQDAKESEVKGAEDFKSKVSIDEAVKIALEKFPELYPVKAELAWYSKGPVWKVYLKESDVMWKYIKIDAESGKIKGRKFSSKRVTKTCAKDKEAWNDAK